MKTLLRRLATTTPSSADLGLLIVRLWFGIVMAVAHGIPKFGKIEAFASGLANNGYPAPELMAWMAALAEAGGGILLALGLLTRPSALALAATMGVAAFVAHADDPFAKQEFALAYGVAALALLVAGPGRLSLDALLFKPGAAQRAGEDNG